MAKKYRKTSQPAREPRGPGRKPRGLLTRKIFVALKTSPVPMRELAAAVGLHCSVLSLCLHGKRRVTHGDPRWVALGALLGVGEVFESIGLDQHDAHVAEQIDVTPLANTPGTL